MVNKALEQTERLKPDLIIMDMVMPVMTGFEAVQTIRTLASAQPYRDYWRVGQRL